MEGDNKQPPVLETSKIEEKSKRSFLQDNSMIEEMLEQKNVKIQLLSIRNFKRDDKQNKDLTYQTSPED